MLLLTLRGTPTLYQGDELGIGKVVIPADRIRDPQHLLQPDLDIGRDRSRTPMPWDATPFAGFSTVEPWLPLNPDWPTRNVAAQAGDPASILSLYQRLLSLRRGEAALSIGSLSLVDADQDVLAYERRHGDVRLLVALNLRSSVRSLPIPSDAGLGETLASTLPAPSPGTVLAADEGRIVRLTGKA
jgi:oligo-1,6-glucosidase/alpha-glucosidase